MALLCGICTHDGPRQHPIQRYVNTNYTAQICQSLLPLHASQPFSRKAKWLLAAFAGLLVFSFFVFPLLLDIPLLDPDEGLHAAMAQEMVERGDLITPRLLGVAFSDKPILFFWTQALSLRFLGMNEAAIRIPGLLFCLLAALTTLFMGRRWFGPTTGLLAGAFYVTLLFPLALSQAPVHDAALVCWTNLTLLSLWNAAQSPSMRGSLGSYALAGIWVGVAILAKGLIGPAIVLLGFGVFLVTTRQLGFRSVLGLAATLLVGAIVASPWYLLMEWQNPGYCYYYFIERHLLGYVTATQRHGDARWWYYLPVFLGGGMPWIASLPAAAADLWHGRKLAASRLNSPRTLCWLYLLCGLIFLSMARSKLITYLWPLFPVIALLAADVWSRCLHGTLAAPCRRLIVTGLGGSCLAFAIALPISLAAAQHRFDLHLGWTWTACAATTAAALMPIVCLWRGSMAQALGGAIISVALLFYFVMAAVMPKIAPEISGRDLARHFNQRGSLPSRLLVLEERIGSLIFYLDPALRAQLQPEQFDNVQIAGFCTLQSAPDDGMAVLPDFRAARASQHLDIAAAAFQRVGHYRIYNANELLRHKR